MKKDIIYSLILLIISSIFTISLTFTTYWAYEVLCGLLGLITYNDFEIYDIFNKVVIEFIVFSVVGFELKFSYKSLMIFFVISMLFTILATHLRGGTLCLMLLNSFVPSYDSFFESLIAPACETICKTLVLLISSLIARNFRKRKKGD